MAKLTKAIFTMAKDMERGFLLDQMDINMKETSKIIFIMVKALAI